MAAADADQNQETLSLALVIGGTGKAHQSRRPSTDSINQLTNGLTAHHPTTSTPSLGLQGGGCLRDLQASGRFRLRTTTRSAKAAAARALAEQGVEVLEGNLLDRPFLDRAMAGVGALFLATFSDHDGTEVVKK